MVGPQDPHSAGARRGHASLRHAAGSLSAKAVLTVVVVTITVTWNESNRAAGKPKARGLS